jgi:hypothetical protein
MEEWRYYCSTILDLRTRWRWVFSFMPLPYYLWGHSSWYSLYRRLGGLQSRSGRFGEEKNCFPLPGIESLYLGSPARSSVAVPSELSQLRLDLYFSLLHGQRVRWGTPLEYTYVYVLVILRSSLTVYCWLQTPVAYYIISHTTDRLYGAKNNF